MTLFYLVYGHIRKKSPFKWGDEIKSTQGGLGLRRRDVYSIKKGREAECMGTWCRKDGSFGVGKTKLNKWRGEQVVRHSLGLEDWWDVRNGRGLENTQKLPSILDEWGVRGANNTINQFIHSFIHPHIQQEAAWAGRTPFLSSGSFQLSLCKSSWGLHFL